MDAARKAIVVTSGTSPDRAIAIEQLLVAAAARAGWSERLEIRLGGIEGGAGRISDAGTAALRSAGIDAAAHVCPDLARRPELFDGAELIVCDRGDVADALVDWDETSEAEFLCVDEITGAADDDGDDAPIGEDVRLYVASIDEVLRRIVADARV